MKNLYFIRHGESVANAGLKTSSPETICLTILWEKQADEIVKNIPVKPDIIIYSPYIRTRQTADPTLRYFFPREVYEFPIQEFSFLDSERHKNTSTQERKRYVAEYWKRLDLHYIDGVWAESFAMFFHRAKIFIKTLNKLSKTNENILVFGHKKFFCMVNMILEKKVRLSKKLMKEFFICSQIFSFENGEIKKVSIAGDKAWIKSRRLYISPR